MYCPQNFASFINVICESLLNDVIHVLHSHNNRSDIKIQVYKSGVD